MSAVRIPWEDHEGWSIVGRSGLRRVYVHDRSRKFFINRRDAEEYFKRMNDSKRDKPAAAGAEGEAEEPAAGGGGRAGDGQHSDGHHQRCLLRPTPKAHQSATGQPHQKAGKTWRQHS